MMANALIESAKISSTSAVAKFSTEIVQVIQKSAERTELHMQTMAESSTKTNEKIDALTNVFTMYLQSQMNKSTE